MTESTPIQIPAVPPFPNLPEAKKAEWRKGYAEAFRRAQADQPNESNQWAQLALREANRMFRVAEPADYEAAMELEDWQFVLREERGDELKLVTLDGKKCSFPVSRRAARQAAGPATKEKKEEKAKS